MAALVFGERTADKAARLRTPLPALEARTACAHVQWDAASPDTAVLFSLAAPALPNALQLRAFAEPGGAVHAALVRGGRWALFADGRRRVGARGLGAGHPVPAGGILVLGQDQDSLGGGFSARDAFSGNLTGFHFPPFANLATPSSGHALPKRVGQVPGPSSLTPFTRVPTLPPNSGAVRPGPLRCTGAFKARTGRALRGVPYVEPRIPYRGLFALPSTTALPLLLPDCLASILSFAETYQRLQDARSWPGQDVISRVNALANAIVLLPDPLSEVHGHLSPAEASSFLGILEGVLAKEAAPLGPAALLAILHFLKRVTALGAGEPEPLRGPWEQLGRGIVSVVSLVLEEQLAGAWLSVSKVVGGPMALVASVQCLAPLVSTVLTPEWPQLHIQRRRAGLEVQSLHLRDASKEGYVFTMPHGHPEGPGHIRIPAGEVKQLLGKGLSRVTVIHSWFSSSVFQHTLGEPGLEPQASDSSEEASKTQRFLSTQVGSAIISSEVWDETREVSMAVTFHLQHQAQRPQHPPASSWSLPSILVHTPAPCPPYTLTHLLCSCFLPSGLPAETGGACLCFLELQYHPGHRGLLGPYWLFCGHCGRGLDCLLLQPQHQLCCPVAGQRSTEEESLLRNALVCGLRCVLLRPGHHLLALPGSQGPQVRASYGPQEPHLLPGLCRGLPHGQRVGKGQQAVMHLLFLVAFSWMLVEGLLLWSKVVVVSMRRGPGMTLYYATGGGVPVAVVAVTLAMSPHDYVAAGHCWLSVHTDAIWAFVGPVLFVLTANTCILVRVVMVTVASARRRARVLSPQPWLQEQVRIQTCCDTLPLSQDWDRDPVSPVPTTSGFEKGQPRAAVEPVLVLLPVPEVLVHLSPAWACAAMGLNSFQFTVEGAEVQTLRGVAEVPGSGLVLELLEASDPRDVSPRAQWVAAALERAAGRGGLVRRTTLSPVNEAVAVALRRASHGPVGGPASGSHGEAPLQRWPGQQRAIAMVTTAVIPVAALRQPQTFLAEVSW
ncbi:adhesion G-protein coupled receptor D2 [Zalophus californianus]|uniref:Adhesion G-protein coupled receptor D2 n=1 Tax=Zalophus californianus TaxID=9704 RepID=A0A6P9FG83_ZALCA|nr:adhesion G-protein coupled receptor D2 [Zalophus californianus]